MIVVTPDVIAWLFFPGEHTQDAEHVLAKNPEWAAPVVWRQEMENILAGLVRAGELHVEDAFWVMEKSAQLMKDREYAVPPDLVLELAEGNALRAHDLAFVALARELGVTLVTGDRAVNAAFPADTMTMKEFWSR
jgi:predicted nucleic acid-binding protein